MSDGPTNGAEVFKAPFQPHAGRPIVLPPPTPEQIEFQRRKVELREQKEKAMAEHRERARQDKLELEKAKIAAGVAARGRAPVPASVQAIEAALEPLISEELAALASDTSLSRDQRIMRLAAMKAMLSSRVSGFLKGMELYARLKGAIPSDHDIEAQQQKSAEEQLDGMFD